MSAKYLHTALRGLQKAIETLSPTNTDAVLVSSFCLYWGARIGTSSPCLASVLKPSLY
jgi:hypothetical protein